MVNPPFGDTDFALVDIPIPARADRSQPVYYRFYTAESTLSKITLPNKGDVVVVSGYLRGDRKEDNEGKDYYPLSLVLSELIKPIM
jgi:hypothetical protein